MHENGGPHGRVTSTAYVLADGYMHHAEASTSSGPVSIDVSRFNAVTISPP